VEPIEQLLDDQIITTENELIKKIEILLSDKSLSGGVPAQPLQDQPITKELFRMLGIC